MYSTGFKMEFSAINATALYSLSKYFVRQLQNEVKKFCLQDMRNAEKCGTYYEHAKILQHDSILEPAAKYIRGNFHCINPNTSRLLHVPDPQFWLDLLKEYYVKQQQQLAQQQADSDEYDDSDSPTFYARNQSTAFSDHISVYCRLHASVTSPETFK
jgi:hypothetical protein